MQELVGDKKEDSMSKKIRQRNHRASLGQQGRSKHLRWGVLLLIATVCLGTVLAPWSNSSGAKMLRAFFFSPAPPPTIPGPTHPTKEYIYAGSKLIATEESGGTTLLMPTNLVATTDSSLPAPHVDINWGATVGADHYQVERTEKVGTSYQSINANVPGNTFTDDGVIAVKSYLYRVRAVDAAGNVSPYSNIDVATAISFEDNTLQIGVTQVKAQHINQLRQAVNAVRAATASLAPASWAENVSPAATYIRADHILELRTKLDQARADLGLTACSYTAAAPGLPILKEHIDQLRQCVK